MSGHVLLVLLAGCAALPLACRPSATQLLLIVESDAPEGAIASFEVVATGASGKTERYAWKRGSEAGSVGILPPNGDPQESLELVITTSGAVHLEARRSIPRFLENETFPLYTCLTAACTPQDPCPRAIADLAAIDAGEEQVIFADTCRARAAPADAGAGSDAEPEEISTGGEDAGLEPPPEVDAGGPDLPLAAWSARLGGDGADRINDVLIDRRGRVIAAGVYNGRLSFARTDYDAPAENGFVAAWDERGRELWFVPLASASGSRVSALALSNDDLYLVATIYEEVHVLGTNLRVQIGEEDGAELLVLRLDISGEAPTTVANMLFEPAQGDQDGRAIAVDQLGRVHVAGNYTDPFQVKGCSIPHHTFTPDVFWVTLTSDLLRCTGGHTFSSNDVDDAEELKVDPQTGAVALGGEMAKDLDLDGDPAADWDGAEDIFVAIAAEEDTTPIKVFAIGGGPSDVDPRIAFDAAGAMHVAAHLASNDFQVASSTFSIDNHNFAFDIEIPNDSGAPSVTQAPAMHANAFSRGVAYLARSDQLAIGGTFRGTVKLGENTFRTNSAMNDDLFLAFMNRGVIEGAQSFGSPEKDDLIRVAASDRAVVAAGTFTATITFPDAASQSSKGGNDAFLYFLPAP